MAEVAEKGIAMRSTAVVVTTDPELKPLIGTGRFVNWNNILSPAMCYDSILEVCTADVVMYLHSDLSIRDEYWKDRVMAEFLTDDDVVAVGLGGATGLGNLDLYRKPYEIMNMVRRNYYSNQVDAEVHGTRFTEVKRVAVLDAFFMAIRTDWLRSIGGWPTKHLTHHCLDLWLACEAARAHKKTMMVGVACHHAGGGVSVTEAYQKARWLQGDTPEMDHYLPHHWIWDSYRDVLPLEVA